MFSTKGIVIRFALDNTFEWFFFITAPDVTSAKRITATHDNITVVILFTIRLHNSQGVAPFRKITSINK
jgi:hypothetical protein